MRVLIRHCADLRKQEENQGQGLLKEHTGAAGSLDPGSKGAGETEEEREKKVVRFQTTPCRAPARRFQGILSAQCRGEGELGSWGAGEEARAEAEGEVSRSEEQLGRLFKARSEGKKISDGGFG
ncbi:hypothetical protein AOLI_G00306030 [Acnodon oligacanthus]